MQYSMVYTMAPLINREHYRPGAWTELGNMSPAISIEVGWKTKTERAARPRPLFKAVMAAMEHLREGRCCIWVFGNIHEK